MALCSDDVRKAGTLPCKIGTRIFVCAKHGVINFGESAGFNQKAFLWQAKVFFSLVSFEWTDFDVRGGTCIVLLRH